MKDMCIPLMFKPYEEIEPYRYYIFVYKAKRVSHNKYGTEKMASHDYYGPYEKITKCGTIIRHILDFGCAFKRIIRSEHEQMFG